MNRTEPFISKEAGVEMKQFKMTKAEEVPLISLRNVHKTYILGVEGVAALRGVTLDVKEGEFMCIYGTSGGGKTTLLNIMGTIDKPTKGQVTICGCKIKSSTEDKLLASLRLSSIGFVFQTFNLIGSLTAIENVELPMILKGELTRSEIRRRAVELLSRFGLQDRLRHFPNQLSGGEQQRVTISRALSNRPKLLLLDEPTGDLDTKNSDLVIKILLDLNEIEGITMIMVTHDMGLKNFANRVVRMIDGKIGKIEEIEDVTRSRAVEELLVSIGSYGGNDQNTEGMNFNEANNLGVREGTRGNQINSKTERRNPMQYAAIKFGKDGLKEGVKEGTKEGVKEASKEFNLPPLQKKASLEIPVIMNKESLLVQENSFKAQKIENEDDFINFSGDQLVL